VADYHRLFVGNTHGSCCGDRHFCWSWPCRPWSVNPSRKLRRFESFTCHHVLEGPLISGNAGQGPFRVVQLAVGANPAAFHPWPARHRFRCRPIPPVLESLTRSCPRDPIELRRRTDVVGLGPIFAEPPVMP